MTGTTRLERRRRELRTWLVTAAREGGLTADGAEKLVTEYDSLTLRPERSRRSYLARALRYSIRNVLSLAEAGQVAIEALDAVIAGKPGAVEDAGVARERLAAACAAADALNDPRRPSGPNAAGGEAR